MRINMIQKQEIEQSSYTKDLHRTKNSFVMFKLLCMMIFTIICFISSNHCVFAQNNINVTTDKENVQKGEEIELIVDIANPDIYSCTLQIYFDLSKLEYVHKTDNSNFSQNRVIYTWTDTTLKNRTVGKTETFTFKALENGSVSLVVTGEFYDKNGNQIEMQDGIASILIGTENETHVITDDNINTESEENVSGDNSDLKIMRLDKEGISPEFQKDVKEYYFVADSSIQNLKVTAIPENAKSTVNVTGNTNLKMGLNTIKIQVESEDKTKKSEYKIYVTKTNNRELANANLENLAIKEGMLYPAFDANITKYHIEVANDVKNLTMLAIPEKINAKVIISGEKDLKIGDNHIVVTVKAEDGITIKKYQITVHRRNNEEEVNAKEELEEQTEQLATILEEEKKENNHAEVVENHTTMSGYDIITFVLLGAIIVGFLICFVIQKIRDQKIKK